MTATSLLQNCPPKVASFYEHVIKEIALAGVCLQVSQKARIYTRDNEEGLACSGFFEDRPLPRLGIALGKPWEEWLPIFAHEFSHFTQWKDQAPVWTNLFADWGHGVEEGSAALDRWLEGEDWSDETLADVISRVRDVELDCEIRTLKLIKAFQLPLNDQEYAQKANAYVYFYNRLSQTRLWYPAQGAPYEKDEVWQSAPTTLSLSPRAPAALEAALVQAYRSKKP